MDVNKLILVLLAILLPPVAVFLHRGIGSDLVINILLCLFFWLPGVLHALYIITR
ncbi:protein of unknown function UPF0057 [Ferrimonas balearica DSM 9799]|uniref:YqaE/Pmp3 family membrane protein n=1 Tax=Ferrimonas balearica (strain DSM 9799 / CCM 4581 / KCTC 23876 / PAT) TaxID=550540 RepID=E1SQZ5_FERBD|nr:YqaE/Pmp3 family membrane protein [Ferrimonas balearica]MBY6019530.1 YqaE/Pmp3 family membrane protein [Halomonas denitrificans]ADN77925.1 protein of unknown function UPF0057 [Ferrimonas balearica DSM 9799]MBW3141384.1 YqaE/Pmp3 family membrane protein [Ferrimonas balearica]MBW3166450.1 YqaE/Pmp3 family membrane protein [Ferrimonas balearica]MBY5982143.1 YqaE/Pmp3 family membrane protein [Ferrimonas balearica]